MAVERRHLTEALLERAHAANEALGAFIHIADETALAAARQADADFAAGIDRGPLQGIPLAIKDIIATEDAPTTANSRVLDPAWGQREDATVMRKLRPAGAIMLGKTVLHEYACGWPDPATGFPIPQEPVGPHAHARRVKLRHRHRHRRRPGIAGLGTDTGGSVRGPSAYCGHQRDQADVRAGQQGGVRPAGVQPGQHRADGAHASGTAR